VKLFNRPKKEYTVTLIPEDFEGEIMHFSDCRGARALRRASKLRGVRWLSYAGYIEPFIPFHLGAKYQSYKDGEPVSMTGGVKPGDVITFKKVV